MSSCLALAVLCIAVTLFLVGLWLTVFLIWTSAGSMLSGNVASTELTVELLEVVTIMLKAVFLIGVRSDLFVAPLNLPIALG